MCCRQHVGAAESVRESDQPGLEIGRWAARWGRAPEDNGFGTVLLFDLREARSDRVEGLLPRDPYPTGVGIALGPGTLQRMKQPVRRIDDFRSGVTLDADPAVRMIRVGSHPGEAAVLDSGNDPALGNAHRAISANSFSCHLVLPVRILPLTPREGASAFLGCTYTYHNYCR
jgi:hypothetical protein